MTLDEAIKIIKSECYIADLLNLDRTRMVNTALDLAIKALRQTDGDCISRQAAINALGECPMVWTDSDAEITAERDWKDTVKMLKSLPSVTPKPKTGHWIVDVDRWGDVVTTVNGYRCDKCSAFNSDKDNYCPNCGADMRESDKG